MTVGLDPDNVIIGAANGPGLWLAPVGTARPTHSYDDFTGDWEAVGYLTEDAVKIGVETDSEDIMVWQSLSAIDTLLKAKKLSLEFTMVEATGANLAIYFDTDAPTVDPDGSFDMNIPTTPAGKKYAAALDTVYSGTVFRIFFDRVTLKSNSEIALGNTKTIPFGVTLSALDNAGSLGGVQRGPAAAPVGS